MSKIQSNNHNRIKNRFIAFALAMILAAVPVISHIGPKSGAKAADPISINLGALSVSYTGAVDQAFDSTLFSSAGAKTVVLPNEMSGVSLTWSLGDSSNNSVKVHDATSPVDIKCQYDVSGTPTDLDSNTVLTDGMQIVLLEKCSFYAGEELSTTITCDEYLQVGTVTISIPGTLGTTTFTSSSETTTYVSTNSVTISGASYGTDNGATLGTLKYGISEAGGLTVANAGDQISWSSSSTLQLAVEGTKYYCYVGVFQGEGENATLVRLQQVQAGKNICWDNQDPEITSNPLYNGSSVVDETGSHFFAESDRDNLKYTVIMRSAGEVSMKCFVYESSTDPTTYTGDGIYHGSASLIDSTNPAGGYKFDIPLSNDDVYDAIVAGKDLVVLAEDASGRHAISNVLAKITIIDKTLKWNEEPKYYVGNTEKVFFTVDSDLPGTGDYSKDTITIKGTAQSGDPIVSITATATVNGTADTSLTVVTVPETLPGTVSTTTGLWLVNFSITLPAEGSYEDVEITVTDAKASSNTITHDSLSDFILDNTAPHKVKVGETEYPYVELQKKLKTESSLDAYVKVPESEIGDDGICMVDVDDDSLYDYRYEMKASGSSEDTAVTSSYMKRIGLYSDDSYQENYPGVLDPYEMTSAHKTEANAAQTLDLLFSVEASNFNPAVGWADTDTGVISPVFMAEDYAGNRTERDATPIKVLRKTMLDSDVTIALYNNEQCSGSPISLVTAANTWTYKNQPIYAKISATSGYQISSITLKGTDQDGNLVDVTPTSFTPATDSVLNEKTRRYEVVTVDTNNNKNTYKVFKIVPTPAVNTTFENIVVTIKDSKATPQQVERTIGNLWYDSTKPIMTQTVTSGTAWTNDPSFNVKITSGNAAPESSIVTGSYVISRSKANTGNPVSANKTGGMVDQTWTKDQIPESTTTQGTLYTFFATDAAGNELDANRTVTIKCDKTRPSLDKVTLNQIPLAEIVDPFSGAVRLHIDASDNLTFASMSAKIKNSSGETWDIANWTFGAGDEAVNITTSKDVEVLNKGGGKVLPDGEYTLTVTLKDKAGNEATKAEKTFIVDSTNPEVTVKIKDGSNVGKRPSTNFDGTARDYYYRGNVSMVFTYTEKDIRTVTVTDNGNPITFTKTWGKAGEKKWINTADFSSEGTHNVKISAVDKAGNAADEKSVTFVIDKGAPTITTTANGYLNFGDGTPAQEFTGDVRIFAGANDAIAVDNDDLNVKITTKRPDQSPTVSGYNKVSNNRTYSFSEEAEYSIDVFAVDMAGNRSGTRTVNFRLDKTAPKLTINGGAIGGVSASATTLTFSMEEAFWWDASGTVTIYRKAGDGAGESLYKTIDYRPTSRNTNVSELISQTGVYRIEFTARDKVGHTAQTSSSITIDRDAPKLTMRAIGNYMLTDKDVDFGAEITDDFYVSKRVEVNATRTKIDGTKETVPIGFVAQSANPTVISQLITEDGIYDITVTATDGAGNRTSDSVHFTIDKTDPEIIDLSEYDDKVVNEFFWNFDAEDLVNDLTVCETHIYLNGREYDGSSTIEDGSYTLLITAVDELGHKTERTIEFILDTKAPTFIVTGVEDGEIKNEVYNIGISLQLDEDTLTSVSLNGKAVDIKDDVVNLTVDQKGDYVLTMTARDEAGNESTQTIRFTFGEKRNYMPLIIGGIVALLALLGCSLFFVLSKRRKNL